MRLLLNESVLGYTCQPEFKLQKSVKLPKITQDSVEEFLECMLELVAQ